MEPNPDLSVGPSPPTADEADQREWFERTGRELRENGATVNGHLQQAHACMRSARRVLDELSKAEGAIGSAAESAYSDLAWADWHLQFVRFLAGEFKYVPPSEGVVGWDGHPGPRGRAADDPGRPIAQVEARLQEHLAKEEESWARFMGTVER